MKITDKAGRTRNIFPYMWTGERWRVCPERVFERLTWWVIYWLIPMLWLGARSGLNLDGTASFIFDTEILKVMPHGYYDPNAPAWWEKDEL